MFSVWREVFFCVLEVFSEGQLWVGGGLGVFLGVWSGCQKDVVDGELVLFFWGVFFVLKEGGGGCYILQVVCDVVEVY